MDTSVWSLALRRRRAGLSDAERDVVATLGELIHDMRVLMIGPIRQEILSGVRRHTQFRRLRDRMRAFEDLPLGPQDYESAAELGNRCRDAGLAVSAVDVLICAVSIRRDTPILTVDDDFTRYAQVLPLRLLDARSG